MGLHDRLKGGSGNGAGVEETLVQRTEVAAAQQQADRAPLDPYAELKTRVHHACIAKLGPELFAAETTGDLSERVLRVVTEQLALDRTPLTRDERRQLVREITDDILGYGPLEPLLRDDSVTEVMVNGADRIYIERNGKIERAGVTFVDDAHLLRIIDKIVSQVGRRVDEASPMVDARLPDGSRVNAIIPPLSLRGPTLTIRKFSRDPYTMNDLISFGTLTPRTAPRSQAWKRRTWRHASLSCSRSTARSRCGGGRSRMRLPLRARSSQQSRRAIEWPSWHSDPASSAFPGSRRMANSPTRRWPDSRSIATRGPRSTTPPATRWSSSRTSREDAS